MTNARQEIFLLFQGVWGTRRFPHSAAWNHPIVSVLEAFDILWSLPFAKQQAEKPVITSHSLSQWIVQKSVSSPFTVCPESTML